MKGACSQSNSGGLLEPYGKSALRAKTKQPSSLTRGRPPQPPRPLLPRQSPGAKGGQAVSGGVLYWRILVRTSGWVVGRILRRLPGMAVEKTRGLSAGFEQRERRASKSFQATSCGRKTAIPLKPAKSVLLKVTTCCNSCRCMAATNLASWARLPEMERSVTSVSQLAKMPRSSRSKTIDLRNSSIAIRASIGVSPSPFWKAGRVATTQYSYSTWGTIAG
jgi:hypothetical protein